MLVLVQATARQSDVGVHHIRRRNVVVVAAAGLAHLAARAPAERGAAAAIAPKHEIGALLIGVSCLRILLVYARASLASSRQQSFQADADFVNRLKAS